MASGRAQRTTPVTPDGIGLRIRTRSRILGGVSGKRRRRRSGAREDVLRRSGFEALLAAGGHVSVVGDCMAPDVPRNASIRAEPCECSGLRPGDVVVVELHGKLVMHRFLARLSLGGRSRLLVKADARWRPDAPLPAESLIARLAEIRDGETARPYSPRALDRVRAAALGMLWSLVLRFARVGSRGARIAT